MKRFLLLLGALAAPTAAHAFSGEDPVFGHPWYHAKITREGAKAAGFESNSAKDAPDLPLGNLPAEIVAAAKDDPRRGGDKAAEALAWHADYLDSYLYSPIWWAQGKNEKGEKGPLGVLRRYKVSRAVEKELKACHFDDLNSTPQVNAMWRRYASGTFAGLMWASEQNDIYAAQNIVGASLHAMQDFYAHSNWIDKPERRTKTYFEYPRATRLTDNLFTGAYEHDHQLGVKSHGKWIPMNSVWGQPGIKQAMEAGCDPISPLSNTDACQAWKEVKAGTSMTPTVGGLKLPPSVMVYTPAGIALDNTWVAEEAVKQRGIDLKGPDAFHTSETLATRQTTQWLQTLERAMKKANKQAFWDKLKITPADDAQRESQFENYSQFPFMFLAAGPYPPTNTGNADEWYLRVKLHTAEGRTGGTDADIKLRAGGKVFDLDYLKGVNPAFTYNDFEAGDNDSYVVGPFNTLPDNIDLINDAADGRELLDALGRDFVNGVKGAVESVGDLLLDIVGGHADKVAVNKQLWMPADLASIPVGAPGRGFNIDLNGGKEGNYQANGTIFKTAENNSEYQFEVHIDSLSCIKESTWDRASFEDEPFLLCAINPFPGNQESWLSPVYKDVDTGETIKVEHGFSTVTIPKSSGMLNLALTLMESDDETENNRKELLAKFAGTYKDKTEGANRTFINALATTAGAKWKLADIEVVAWSRNGNVRQGTVLRRAANRWVEPGTFANFPLDTTKARSYNITIDDLLPELSVNGNPEHGADPVTPDPNQPTEPTLPDPADLSTWVDTWDTTYGRVKLELTDGVLRGRLYILDEWTRREKESDMLELRAGELAGDLTGKSTYAKTDTPISMTLAADGNSFTGTSGRPGMTGQWNGTRHKAPTSPTTPSDPTVPTIPTIPAPTIPTPPLPNTPTIPTTPSTPTGVNGFRPLDDWSVQIESTRVARENQIEVVALWKNTQRNRLSLDAGTVDMVITDSDGVGIHNIGNLYRAGGDPDMTPEKLGPYIQLESGSQGRVLTLFDIPAGATPLKTLTIFSRTGKVITFDISNLTLPEPIQSVSTPPVGAVSSNGQFTDFGSYGVRFDGIRKGKNGSLQMFLTVKNNEKAKWITHPGLGLDVAVVDADGLTINDEGNLYRASGAPLDLQRVQHGVYIVPNGETTLCYPVNMPKGAVAKQLLVKFQDKSLTFPLPALP